MSIVKARFALLIQKHGNVTDVNIIRSGETFACQSDQSRSNVFSCWFFFFYFQGVPSLKHQQGLRPLYLRQDCYNLNFLTSSSQIFFALREASGVEYLKTEFCFNLFEASVRFPEKPPVIFAAFLSFFHAIDPYRALEDLSMAAASPPAALLMAPTSRKNYFPYVALIMLARQEIRFSCTSTLIRPLLNHSFILLVCV